VDRLFPRRRRRGFDPLSRMEDSDILRNLGQKLARDQGLEMLKYLKLEGSRWEQSFQGCLLAYFRMSIIGNLV
jgi:hypothetical protein